MKRWVFLFSAFLVAIFLVLISTLSQTSSAEKDSIQIKGSDTMVNLGQGWAEAFMQENPSALIAVTGGGSGTGIAAAISGTCDVAQSSREMTSKEYELAKTKGHNIKEVQVAIDAIAFRSEE